MLHAATLENDTGFKRRGLGCRQVPAEIAGNNQTQAAPAFENNKRE